MGACGESAAAPDPLQYAMPSDKPAQSMLVIAEGEQAPSSMALDDSYVYWVAGAALRRAPLDGGPAETLANVSNVGNLVADGGAVFFTDGRAGTVLRVDRDGNTTVVGRGVQPWGVAARDGQVFWASSGMTVGVESDGSISSAKQDGSDARVLLDGVSAPMAIAVDAQHIYFARTSQSCWAQTPPSGQTMSGCSGGGVHALPRAGGEAIVVDAQATPLELALSARGVFWIAGGPTRVMFAPLGSSGVAQTLVQSFSERPGPMAIDDEALYFSSTDTGRVMKLGVAESELVPVAVDLGTVGDIAVDSRGVYVAATAQGRILRFAKDGSGARPDQPVSGPCPVPLGTAAEIAATPRADSNLEQLALRLEPDRVVASQEMYDRVVADVSAVRALDAERNGIGYFARDDARTLMLELSDKAFQSFEDGEYSAWDCLNNFYGLKNQVPMRIFSNNYVVLELKGNYNLELIKTVYAKLPGVEDSSPNGFGGDTSTICARQSGETIEYVFDRRDGDCPAGCIEHNAKHFVSTGAGVIEARESWDNTTEPTTPAWYSALCTNR